MRKFWIAGAALVALAACDNATDAGAKYGDYEEAYFTAPAAAPAPPALEDALAVTGARRGAGADGVAGGSPNAPTAEQLEATGTLLAYSYSTSLQMPARNVRSVMEAHEAECRAAGPAICQVLNSGVNEYGENNINASLYIRAVPDWLATFRGGLEDDARAANGKIVSANVSSEDLTRAIVDTEAQLRAKRTLRERLENLLANQTGDVGDLLAVERELARVQAELDSAQSNLEVMRKRVSMSTLSLGYSSTPVALSQNAFAPIGAAFTAFFGIFSRALAGIIRGVAFFTPYVLIGVPVVWGLRRWWRGRRARKNVARA